MSKSLLLIAVVFAVTMLCAPSAHAQLVGGDPSNNIVCPADLSEAGCQAAGWGGGTSGSSGGGISIRCRSQGTPETKCYGQSYSNGRLQPVCFRQDVATGWCVCVNGKLSRSCTTY